MRCNYNDFIGTKFKTEGGELTVLGFNGRDSRGIAQFTVECSVCSKDKELFRDPFIMTKGSLQKGGVPCGCSKNIRYSSEQYKIIIKRKLLLVNPKLKFDGFVGEFKGKRDTKLLISYNDTLIDGTPTIDNVLSGKSLRILNAKYKNTRLKTIDDIIFKLKQFGFYDDKRQYKRSPDNKCVLVTCPVCSADEYVKNGLCDGWFSITIQNLLKGLTPCRCGWFMWTKSQREYQIKKICESENLTFKNIIGDYNKNRSSSKIAWICEHGHECETNMVDFISTGIRCKYCQREDSTYYGYYPKFSDRKDYLYLIKINNRNNTFYKIGRSFTPNIRFSRLKTEVDGCTIDTISLWQGLHSDVYAEEASVLYAFKEYSLHTQTFNGHTECFTSDVNVEDIINRISVNLKLIKQEL